MKKIFFLVSSFLIAGMVSAQSAYFVHTIKDGETLTKLANKYGTTVGDIMRLNKMTTSSKLEIGEEVKIPKTGDNAVTESTHAVAKGETLYSIAHKNHITVAQLRDWNNIPDNTIHEGQVLRLTAPDGSSGNAPVSDNTANTAATPVEDSAPVSSGTDAKSSESADINTANDTKQRADDDAAAAPVSNVVGMNPDEGVFATAYQSHANGTELITKGSAAVFKTASGWQDKKYYILMNDIAPGTIVKVQANGKTVYAKVLWNLGNVKENQGLTYRISDAAANVLNLSGDTFDIIVSYYK